MDFGACSKIFKIEMTIWSGWKRTLTPLNLTTYFSYSNKNPNKDSLFSHMKRWMSDETNEVTQGVTKKVPKQFSEIKKTPFSSYIFPITCFCLGTWQLYRHRRREGLILKSIQNMNDPIVEKLPKCVARNLFKKVRLEGEFLFDELAKVGPCLFLEGCNHNTVADFHAYVPFKLKSNGKTILVDLGLLRHSETPAFNEYCQMHKGDTVVEGYFRRLYMPSTLTHKRLWLLHNYGQYYLQKAPSKDHMREPGEPLTYTPEVDHYNMHTEYLIFWYVLSAILFYSVYRARK